MEGHIKSIGGEHVFDINIFNKNNDNLKNMKGVFLDGGQDAIRYIIKNLNIKEDEYILMPNYLCPTILYNLKNQNIKYEFYKIKEDLSIDTNDIAYKLEKLKVKAIFFINYFGFYHDDDTVNFLKKLQNEKITIIEDSVQMLWFENVNFIGDYVFNSYRKFVPIDGSLVLCNSKEEIKERKDDYYNYINKARYAKTLYTHYEIGNEEDFLKLYEIAEENYYKRKEIHGMSEVSKNLLSKIDANYIGKKRIENYKYIYRELEKIKGIKILFNENKINNNIPLGFPIMIENRDYIRSELRKNNIYCPVHWNMPWVPYTQNILTIPIDQRYDFNDMDKIIKNIKILI